MLLAMALLLGVLGFNDPLHFTGVLLVLLRVLLLLVLLVLLLLVLQIQALALLRTKEVL